MHFSPKFHLNPFRNYSTCFTKESAETLSNSPFVQKFLKQIKNEDFAKAYAKHNPKAIENLKMIQDAGKPQLISALFKPSLDKDFMALEKSCDFPLFELVDRVANNLRE